jgi:hypothetical protein
MTLPVPQPIEGESLQAHRAFKTYVALGRKRSQVLVGRRLGISRQLCSRWSAKHRWIERLRELEVTALEQANEAQRIADQKAKEEVAQQIERERLRFIRRQIEASERATAKALEILNQPYGECTPPEAARLLAVGQSIGASLFGLQSATLHGELQTAGQRQVTNIILTRDGESDKAARVYYDYFRQNPTHPQSARFCSEWEQLCAERGKSLDWRPDEDAPALQNGEGEE